MEGVAAGCGGSGPAEGLKTIDADGRRDDAKRTEVYSGVAGGGGGSDGVQKAAAGGASAAADADDGSAADDPDDADTYTDVDA